MVIFTFHVGFSPAHDFAYKVKNTIVALMSLQRHYLSQNFSKVFVVLLRIIQSSKNISTRFQNRGQSCKRHLSVSYSHFQTLLFIADHYATHHSLRPQPPLVQVLPSPSIQTLPFLLVISMIPCGLCFLILAVLVRMILNATILLWLYTILIFFCTDYVWALMDLRTQPEKPADVSYLQALFRSFLTLVQICSIIFFYLLDNKPKSYELSYMSRFYLFLTCFCVFAARYLWTTVPAQGGKAKIPQKASSGSPTSTGQTSSRQSAETPESGLRRRRPSQPAPLAGTTAESHEIIPNRSTQIVYEAQHALRSMRLHPSSSSLSATSHNFQHDNSDPPPAYTENNEMRVPRIPLPLSRIDR